MHTQFIDRYCTQWPDDKLLPGFKDVFTSYIDRLQKLSYELLSLVAEALGLAPNSFAHFFEADGNEDRAKIVKDAFAGSNLHFVYGDLDAVDVIEKAAAEADIVIR